MKPYIVEINSETGEPPMTVSIAADNQVEAEAFARNYFGDYRADYRNKNAVSSCGTDTLGEQVIYKFTVVSVLPKRT